MISLVFVAMILGVEPESKPLPWKEKLPANASVVGAGADQLVTVTGSANPTNTVVLDLQNPSLPHHQYLLKSKIKFENVKGDGYLEMLNYFESGGPYFTRTLATTGQLGKITGTSDFREIALPFNASNGVLPKRITVAVVLPGEGKVTIKPFVTEQWTTFSLLTYESGLLGAIVGGICGLLGGFFGVMAAIPPLRRYMFPFGIFVAGCSVIMLIVGLVFLCTGQPWGLWYPLVLVGILGTVIFGVNAFVARHRLMADESRRIAAASALSQ